MLVTFVLLANDRLHNIIRQLTLEIHRTHQAEIYAGLLPPHISLKQPFAITDLARIETFFDQFAARLAPIDLTLTEVSGPVLHEPLPDRGVLWLEVIETPALRALHERLNVELAEQFTATEAPFDGAAYHFHATVALVAGARRYGAIRRAFDGRRVDLTYRPTQIALVYYADDTFAPGTFMTYKVLPVGDRPGGG